MENSCTFNVIKDSITEEMFRLWAESELLFVDKYSLDLFNIMQHLYNTAINKQAVQAWAICKYADLPDGQLIGALKSDWRRDSVHYRVLSTLIEEANSQGQDKSKLSYMKFYSAYHRLADDDEIVELMNEVKDELFS